MSGIPILPSDSTTTWRIIIRNLHSRLRDWRVLEKIFDYVNLAELKDKKRDWDHNTFKYYSSNAEMLHRVKFEAEMEIFEREMRKKLTSSRD